jgi:hypothetical protein
MPPVFLTKPFTPGEKDDLFDPIRLVPLRVANAANYLSGGAFRNGWTSGKAEGMARPADPPRIMASGASGTPSPLPSESSGSSSTSPLPDLIPWLPGSLDAEVVVDPKTGHKVLNFSAAVANVGNAPLAVDLEGDLYDTRYHFGGFDFDRPAYQIIRQPDGSTLRIPAGVFMFREGGGNDNYNMRDLVHFRLRKLGEDGQPGDVVGGNVDGFFFLADMEIAPGTRGTPSTPEFSGVDYSDLPGQGLSVGWITQFPGRRGLVGKFVPGHTIDVEDLPPGRYVLEIEVDPTNRFVERDETNNIGRIEVTI